MTGDSPPDATPTAKSVPREVIAAGVEYELVEGELMPRSADARPWDPAVDLR